MTKSGIMIRLNRINLDSLHKAICLACNLDEFTRNRASFRIYNGKYVGISFSSRATKANMEAVYYEILDRIILNEGLEAISYIDPDYIPTWYNELTAEKISAIKTPGNIIIRAKKAGFIEGRPIRKGEEFVIYTNGGGWHDLPGNAYGKLYGFHIAEHGCFFEIIAVPEESKTEVTEEPKEEESMSVKIAQTIEVINDMIAENPDDFRYTSKTIRGDRDTFEAIYAETRGGNPSETVRKLVEAIGYDRAVTLIATLVNRFSDDGRISYNNEMWAASTPTAWNAECALRFNLYSLTIHLAHLDQIANVMREYKPEPEEASFAFRLIDATQDLSIGVAKDEAEAVQMWEKAMERDSSRDVMILDANGEEVTLRLLTDATNAETVVMVSIDSIREELDPGEYGCFLNDYRNGDGHISDIVCQIADDNTSLYYSDILKFISANPESLSEVINEGLYDPSHNYNLYEHAQAAEYMLIERDVMEHLSDSMYILALDHLEYDYGTKEIPEDLVEKIREWCEDPYGERISYIRDHIDEYMSELNEEV